MRASTIDELADAVVEGVADLLGATRCTLLKAAPELLMPLGTADAAPCWMRSSRSPVPSCGRRKPAS